jgi:hypothetical protein
VHGLSGALPRKQSPWWVAATGHVITQHAEFHWRGVGSITERCGAPTRRIFESGNHGGSDGGGDDDEVSRRGEGVFERWVCFEMNANDAFIP